MSWNVDFVNHHLNLLSFLAKRIKTIQDKLSFSQHQYLNLCKYLNLLSLCIFQIVHSCLIGISLVMLTFKIILFPLQS